MEGMEGIKRWIRREPDFKCDRLCRPLYAAAPWSGLRPFVYDYLCNIRPSTVVELGTHYGCSAFCFMQAMQDEVPDTRLTLIDTWEGDPFTIHDYRDDVYGSFRRVMETCYPGLPVRVLRERFSDAAGRFERGSIQLLHLDGSHLYREVRRDFEDWYDKVSEDGAIFLHDVTAEKDGHLLGSGVFWKELQGAFPYTVTIPCSCGLGILARQERQIDLLRTAVRDPGYQRRYERENEEIKAWLREMWFAAGGT